MTSLTSLLSQHGVASLDKQKCLADVIGNADWQFNMDAGQLTFGGQYVFPVQILGTESHQSHTWLWGWANAASAIPEPLLRAAKQLQAYGEQHDVPEFTGPQQTLDAVSGHLLCMIACGLCEADCYYRGPYAGGAAFMLLSAPEVRQRSDDTALRFIHVYNEFLIQFSCDHRQALVSYADYKRFLVSEEGSVVVCTSPHGEAVRASFDSLGRLAGIESKVTAAPPPPAAEKKPWWNSKR